jgi:hypothetical protein
MLGTASQHAAPQASTLAKSEEQVNAVSEAFILYVPPLAVMQLSAFALDTISAKAIARVFWLAIASVQ